MTVSRVINGGAHVSNATREKVLRAIEALSYYPNAAARVLTGNKTGALEIVMPSQDYFYSSEYFSELIFGVERIVRERGYNVVFNTYDPAGSIDFPALYKQRKVDGLMIVARSMTDRHIDSLHAEGVPFVLVNARRDDIPAPYVDVDNVLGARLAVEHLFSLSHRLVGIVTGGTLAINSLHRLQGYREAHELRGQPIREDLICQGNWSEESGYEGLRRLHALTGAPDAVFCCNDLMAIGAMRAAADLGLVVPRDVSIIGFDDIHLASYVNPRLTTVRQPIGRVGEEAARVLIDVLEETVRGPRRLILPPELIVRSSCQEKVSGSQS